MGVLIPRSDVSYEKRCHDYLVRHREGTLHSAERGRCRADLIKNKLILMERIISTRFNLLFSNHIPCLSAAVTAELELNEEMFKKGKKAVNFTKANTRQLV